jgi:dTDP-4-dehydrorhamnose reductase
MLRLSETQLMVRTVDDQRGTPTSAADLAAAILAIVERLRLPDGRDHAGICHLAGEGETSWHGFAAAIFASLARCGRRVPRLQAITTAGYPNSSSPSDEFMSRIVQGGARFWRSARFLAVFA